MKRNIFFMLAALAALNASAQTMDIHQGSVTYSYQLGQAGEMTYTDATTLNVGGRDYIINEIDQIDVTTDGEVSDNTVQVTYSGNTASVVVAGNIAQYMTVSVSGADVSVVADSTLQQEVVYTLKGQTTDGTFYMDGEYKSTLILDGVSIANQDGAAIQVDNGKRINVTLADGTTSTLSDGAGNQKAAFFINGHAEFEGSGTLNLVGNSKHAYRSDEYTQLKNGFTGAINVTASVSDAMHVGQYLQVKNGTLNLTTAGGDGIDVAVTSDATDELNGQLLIEGGNINVNVTGTACKGLKSDSLMSISGGVVTVVTSGNGTVTTDSSTGLEDSSTAAAAKCGGNFVMSAGQVSLTSTGEGAKGINCDGIVYVSDGILTVVTTGDVYEYTANGVEDDSKAHGVKSDKGIVLSGGYIYAFASTDKGTPFKTDGSILFNGGTILGAGNKATNVAAASTQYYKSLSAQKLTAGATYTAGDVTVTVPSTYSNSKANVVVSSPTMSASGSSQSELSDNNVTVTWSGNSATVDVADNIADALTVSNTGGVVSILQSDALANEVTYTLSGNGTGSFYTDGSYKASYVFNSLTLTSSDSAVVNIDNGKRLAITLNGTSTLTDAANGSHKGTLMLNGHSEFSGTGTLVLKGNTKNALWADEYVLLTSDFTGTIKVTGAVNDGFNINQYYQQDGGSVVISSVGDDGIAVSATSDTTDEYNGQIFLNGGSANITVTAAAAKGIKCDGLFTIAGGDYSVTTSGGGKYDSTARDAKGCSALNTDGNMVVSGGSLNLKSTGAGGKCIKVDGTLTQTDGTIVATSTGAQYKYSSSYTCSAKAIKANGAISISGGKTTASASSHEAIETKSTLTISGGIVEATSSDDAINAASHFTITGGQVYGYSSGNDGLDANGNLIIKGGTVVARGSGSPECGLDANEEGGYNLYITGGTVIGFGGGNSPVKTNTSIGTGQACITFNGSVTTTMAVNGVVSFNMSALQTAVTAAEMVEALNTEIANTRVVPKMKERPGMDLMPMEQDRGAMMPMGTGAPIMRGPGGGGPGGGPGGGGSSSGNSWLISSPNLTTGSSYTVLSGCTLSGGTFFHGLSTDASVSGGSTLATATAATTTSSSGGGPGGGGGWW